MPSNTREFSVSDAYVYDHRSPWRWVGSHIRRYPWLPVLFGITTGAMAGAQSLAAVLMGRAFDTVVAGATTAMIAWGAAARAAAVDAGSGLGKVDTKVVRRL